MAVEALLEVKGLKVAYGHIEAVKGIDFRVDAGEAVTLVGANGAGKSTTLLAMSGLLRGVARCAGSVRFEGEELLGLAPQQIVERGVVQVAEGRAILTTLTVRENLELGAYRRRDRGAIASDLDAVLTRFPRLRDRLDGLAGNLSGGEQQMLAIGRALMARPRLLLLDEPSMGLAPLMVKEIFQTLAEIHRGGLTVLLVEQNSRQALRMTSRGYVIETGAIALSGPSDELLRDTRIVEAYLGG